MQHEQRARLGRELPLAQLELPFMFTPDLGRAELTILADELTRDIEALPEPGSE